MRRSSSLAAGLGAMLFALALSAPIGAQSPHKALVYCPVGVDVTGCEQIVTALADLFAGVDRAYDGTSGTVDLRTADINHYAVFVVPSLADGAETKPYALLRDTAVAQRLKSVLRGGRVAVWSGTPDQGDANREAKNTLIRNAAEWASKPDTGSGVTGAVVFQDLSDVVGERYGWLGGVSSITVQADSSLDVYESVESVSPAGDEIIKNGDQQLAYANMASFGLHLPADASGMLAGALGGAENRQIVLVTYQGDEAVASVKTDKEDYWPGEIVTITGSGWQPGDTVLMVLHEDPLQHENRTITAIADESGAFVDTTFSPELHDLGVKFLLTAVGRPSGRTAQTTFTDGNGVITGTVTSSVSGNPPIEGATVTCIGGCKAPTPSATTGSNGFYSLQVSFDGNVKVVRLRASKAGYTSAQRDITVGNNNTIKNQDFTLTPTASATTLAVAAAAGTYGGTTTLSATLTASGTPVGERSVSFTLNGTGVGSATTDASGVATLSDVSLAGINAGTHSGGVAASFAGDPAYAASSGSNTLTISKASLTVTANDATKIYGDALPSFSAFFDGFVSDDGEADLTGTLAFETPATASSGVGSYAITPKGLSSANYEIAFVAGVLAVTARPATVTVNSASRAYGAANPTFTAQFGGLVGADALTCDITTAATTATAVGDYPITATCAENANYLVTVAPGTLSITKAALTVTAEAQTKAYGTADPVLTYRITSGALVGDDALSGSLTRVSGETVAGSPYAIQQGTLSAGSNYDLTFAGSALTITRAPLTVTADNQARVYGETNPELTGTLTGVVSGDDITASYTTTATAASPIGPYPITPVLSDPSQKLGNYEVSSTNGTLTVTKATLTVSAANASRAYGEANPAFTGTIAGQKNGETFTATYASAATAASAIGEYAITVSDVQGPTVGNYEVTTNAGTLTITKASLTAAAADASRLYGQTNPAFSGTVTGLKNNDNITATYATAATASSDVGPYPITPALSDPDSRLGNYEVTLTDGVLTINEAPLTVTADDKSKVYGSENPAFTASYTGFVLEQTPAVLGGTLAFATAATQASAVGPYAVTPSGLTSGNYEITFESGTLTVTPATLTVTPASVTRTYGASNPALTGTISGFVLGEGPGVLTTQPSYATAATAASAAGPYAITASGAVAPNYTFTYNEGTLTVAPAPLTVTANDASRLYGQGNPAFTARYDGFVLDEGPAALSGSLGFDTDAAESSDVGSYDVTPKGLTSANYAISFVKGTLSVTPAPLTVTAVDNNKPYDGEPFTGFTASYSGFVLGQTESVLGGALAFGGSAVGATDVGTYVITPSGLTSTNYAISFVNGTLTIGKALLTVTATGQDKVYDGTTAAVVTLADDRRSDDAITVNYTSATFEDKNVGTGKTVTVSGISISGADAENYTLASSSATTTAKITARPITVTADAKTKASGAPDPALTYQITSGSLVDGDVFSGALTRVAGEAAGDYAIQQGDLSAGDNYVLTFVGSTLTITKGTATLSLTGLSQTYDGTPKSVTVTTDPAGLTGVSVTYDGSSTVPTNAGSYAVVASLTNDSYVAEDAKGTLVIAKAEQTITLNLPASNTFGGLAPSVSASASSGLPVTFTFPTSDRCNKVSADGKLNVIDVGVDGGPGVAGPCRLTASQAGSVNYNSASVTKTLDVLNKLDAIINNADNTLSWSSTSKEFTIAVMTLKSADGTTLFDAARVDPAKVTVTGPQGTAPVSLDQKGQPKAVTMDVDLDGKQDRVFYFSKSAVFGSGDVNKKHTVTLNGSLKQDGSVKQDGRSISGKDQIQLTP